MRNSSLAAALSAAATADQARNKEKVLPDTPRGGIGGSTGIPGPAGRSNTPDSGTQKGGAAMGHKHRSSLSNLGRLGIGGRKSKR